MFRTFAFAAFELNILDTAYLNIIASLSLINLIKF